MMQNKINIKKLLLNGKNKCAIVSDIDFDLDKVANILNNDIKIIIFKNNVLNDTDFLNIALKIRQLTSLYEALFLIERRIDLAFLADSDGVFLDNSSVKAIDAIKILTKDKFFATTSANDPQSDFIICDNEISENKLNKPIFQLYESNIYKNIG